MHITENEEHMKRIKDEFEGRSGVTSQNVAETFKTAKNQNVAWATYIVLRSSGSYPTLVNKSTKHSQRIQAQYAQLAQQFAQSPEVQEFIEQLREQKVTKVTQSSSATASAISSFDELFQMHITENEEHMKRIKDEFEGRSGVTSQNVAETFKTAKNQNVAWATYIVLRSSGSYPTLVNKSKKHSQRIQAQYAQLAQQFAQSPEVQEFIEQLREQKVTKVTQSSLPHDIDSRVVTEIKQFYSLYNPLLAKSGNPSIAYTTLLAKSAAQNYFALQGFLRTIDSYLKTLNDINVKESDIAFLIPSFKVDKEKKKSISQKDLRQLLASRATTLKELISMTLKQAQVLPSLFVDEDMLNKALLNDNVFQSKVLKLSA